MRQINTNMFHFLKKYSPDYAQNTIEGWSIILVVAVGCEVSSFANSWLGMLGMFVIGPAHEARPLCLAHLCVKIREEVGESLAKQSLESTVGVSFGICSGFVRDALLSRFFTMQSYYIQIWQ